MNCDNKKTNPTSNKLYKYSGKHYAIHDLVDLTKFALDIKLAPLKPLELVWIHSYLRILYRHSDNHLRIDLGLDSY